MKSERFEDSLNRFTKAAFGRRRDESHNSQICVICRGEANFFRDELSRKEYNISKLCQKCQDEIFGTMTRG